MSAIQRIAVNTDKDKETWLALRKQDVTASDAGALLGIHEFKTLLDLYGNKTGTLKEQPENDAMRRGKKLEGVAVWIDMAVIRRGGKGGGRHKRHASGEA